MKVIKRNGSEVDFEVTKIGNAIGAANAEVTDRYRIDEAEIERLADNVAYKCEKYDRAVGVEEIQELVETEIIDRKSVV